MFARSILFAAWASTALAGTTIWDGRFNEFSSSADLNNWSWGNQVGPYQYYIHGTGTVDKYVNLSPSYKNPADAASKQGAKITIDSTAKWNSDMWRTELIPQTSAAINKGKTYYHFSMKRTGTNAPSIYHEHQVNFFESHFTEMKYGWINGQSGTSNDNLQWMVGGQGKWSIKWEADVWHNIAYEIDFSAGTVAFWHSTGSDALTKKAGPFSASTSSNGADWHLGVLRLPRSGYDNNNAEDWYFSGVYIETGTLTTTIGSGTSNPPPVSSTSTTASATPTPTKTTLVTSTVKTTPSPTSSATPTPAPTTSTPGPEPSTPAGTVPQWAQCGGINHSGGTVCISPYKCVVVNDWYSQCQ